MNPPFSLENVWILHNFSPQKISMSQNICQENAWNSNQASCHQSDTTVLFPTASPYGSHVLVFHSRVMKEMVTNEKFCSQCLSELLA